MGLSLSVILVKYPSAGWWLGYDRRDQTARLRQ